MPSSLENIVYLELCRRGYRVFVGKTEDGEIDFVAERLHEKIEDNCTPFHYPVPSAPLSGNPKLSLQKMYFPYYEK